MERISFNPNGTVNYSGRQQTRGVLTSRDLYGTECQMCDGSGSVSMVDASGNSVGQTDCPDCDGAGVTQEN